MRESAFVAVLVAACGPGLVQVQHTQRETTQDSATSFARAADRGDVAAVRSMLGPSVVNGGLWFADSACEAEFAVPGDVGGGRLDELARCLAMTKPTVSSRRDSLPDVAVLAYAPGIEVEARFVERPEGPWLSWIGYVARRDVADALPTVTPETLESLRVAGNREPQVPELQKSIAVSRRKYAYAWVKLCIDAEGTVTGLHVREASSTKALHAFTDAIADWKFRPFAPAGHPLPVCSMTLLASPLALATRTQPIPMPMEGEEPSVEPDALVRTSGERAIAPDDDDKRRVQKMPGHYVVGAFKVCLDTAGSVTGVTVLRSTGLPMYDAKIIHFVEQWHYQPYLDDDVAKAVCTGVNFIYTQR